MKKWKCTVCGYIHTGAEPPEKCPICGADRSKFILIEEEVLPVAASFKATDKRKGGQKRQPEGTPEAQAGLAGLYRKTSPLLTRLHAHPVAVHIPNGVLPVALVFLLCGAALNCSSLVTAGFYNLVVVLLAMPAVLVTGYNDWQQRYGGNLSDLFVTKIACGIVVTCGCLALVVWMLARPELLVSASISRRVFFFCGLITLAAAVVAGFCGGKLVFFHQDKKENEP